MSAQVTVAPVMTTVDIDLVDSKGARWAGAKVIVTFVAAPNTPAPYLWDGAAFQQHYYFENIGPSGHFTIDLPANLDITPRGNESFWRFDIAPNMDDGRSVPIIAQLSTSAQDLSAAFAFATQQLVQFLVQSIPVPRASGDFDVIITPNDGQLYFDVTMQQLKVWANGGWQVVEAGGGGGGISYPPPGIAVSQGTAWGVSIDPATLALKTDLGNYLPLTGGTVTGTVNLNASSNILNFTAAGVQTWAAQGGLEFYGTNVNFACPVFMWNGASFGLDHDPTQPLEAATKQYVDAAIGGVGGMVFPPAGIGVSNGSAWTNSIDPATLVTTNQLANYLPLTGGTLTGNLVLPNAGVISFGAQPNTGYGQVSGDGNQITLYGFYQAIITGFGGTRCIFGNGYTYFYMPITMQSGTTLTLAADPVNPLQAATKQYVDNVAGNIGAGYLPLTGGNISGILSFGATTNTQFPELSASVGGNQFNIVAAQTISMGIPGSTNLTLNAATGCSISSPMNVSGFISTNGGDVIVRGYSGFPPLNRGISQTILTGSALGLVIVNSSANTDQKTSYIQVAQGATSGTIHYGFQNDAGNQNHDYFVVTPSGNKASTLAINSDSTVFSSGDSSIAYGSINNAGMLTFNAGIKATGTVNNNLQWEIAESHVLIGVGDGSANIPLVQMVNATAAVDQKGYDWLVMADGTLHGRLINDAGGTAQDWMLLTRSAMAVTQLKLSSAKTYVGWANPLCFFDRSNVDTSLYPTTPNINCDATNLFLEPSTASGGAIFLNWDQGTAVAIGNGNKASPGAVIQFSSTDGSALFLGKITCNNGLAISGSSTFNGGTQFNNGVTWVDTGTPNLTNLLIYPAQPGAGSFIPWSQAGDALIFVQRDGGGSAGLCIGGWSSNPGIRIDMGANSISLHGIMYTDSLIQTANQGISIAGGGANFYWDGGSSFLNGAPAGRLLINAAWGTGEGTSDTEIFGSLILHGVKTFVVDYPGDDTKSLYHACLEGPENGVYYRGQGVTDDYGEAEILLPEYFEELTFEDERTVILTTIYEDDDEEFGQVAASLVHNGRFHVRSQYAQQGFYWEVKAIRKIGVLGKLEVVRSKTEYEVDLHRKIKAGTFKQEIQ